MLLSHARAVTGGLGKPSKMPGRAYGLPAQRCIRGKRLHAISGSVCEHCYALKGRYVFGSVRAAQERRYASLGALEWVPAMTALINAECAREPWFRWHDSGDLQGVWHLRRIVRVVLATPTVRHWLPTREDDIVREYTTRARDGLELPVPPNLTIRISADTVGEGPPPTLLPTSTVHARRGDPWRDMEQLKSSVECRAYTRENTCGPCRACWSPLVKNISYPAH